jgi:gliding motility-associated-like protein
MKIKVTYKQSKAKDAKRSKNILFSALLVAVMLFLSTTLNGQVISNSNAYLNITEKTVIGSKDIFNASGGHLSNFGVLSLTGNFSNFAISQGNGLYRLDGNWLNTGIFYQDFSTVLLKGSGNQSITSTGGATFFNLSINNSGAPLSYRIIMDNNVTVTDTLSIADGNIDPQTFLLYLSSNKANSLNYSSTTGSRVMGKFQRGVGEQGLYLFPLGYAHYNPITITPNGIPDSGPILSQFFVADPGSGGLPIPDPPVEVWEAYPDGFWRLTAGNFFSSDNFNISVNAAGFVDSIFPSTRLLKRTAANPWLVDGYHIDADTIGQNVIYRGELSGDIAPTGTEFALGRIRALITEQPIDTTVCETTDATFSVTATGVQTLRYFWYRLESGVGVRISNIGPKYSGARTSTLTIHDAQLSDIGDYFCVIADRNNNLVSTDTVHLHVNKIPIATVSVAAQNHECSNIEFEDIALGFSWWDVGSTFVWERDNPAGIVSAIPMTGTANNIGDVLEGLFTNTTDAPLTVTFTITPVGPAPTFCTGLSITSTVTVNPIPRVIVADTISEICYGAQMSVLLTTPTVMTTGNVRFDYTVGVTGMPGDVVGNTAAANNLSNNTLLTYAYTNSADSLNSVFYYITPQNDPSGCYAGDIVAAEVKVHPRPLRQVYISEPFTCFGNPDGVLTAVLAKSSKPNTLHWTGPWGVNETYQETADTSNFSILYSGPYNLTVTDNLNCTNSINNTLVFGTAFETLFSAGKKASGYNTTCWYINDGTITLGEVANVDAPFEYWILLNNQDTVRHGTLATRNEFKTETGLAPGYYKLLLRDANGCYNDYFPEIRIVAPPVIKIHEFGKSDYLGYNVSCTGYNDGSVWIDSISGGNQNYSYFWYTYDGAITGDNTQYRLDNIPAGKYFVRVTDWLGCEIIDSVTLTQPDGMNLDSYSVSASQDGNYNISCSGGNDGFIEIEITGGLGDYSYNWSNGEGYESTEKDIYNLSAGTYTATVTDQNGCILKLAPTSTLPVFTLSEPVPLSLEADISVSTDGAYNINCFGGTGSIDITVSGGSTGNYTYEWTTTDGLGLIATAEDQPSITAGSYQLRVTDLNGCIIDTTLTLTEPSPIGSVLNPTHITCYPEGFNNGSIDLTITGGVEPYGGFIWSNGSTSEDISGLTEGKYIVTFVDANGCAKTDSVNIELPPDLIYTTTMSDYNGFNVSCYGLSDAWIKVDMESGRAPYIITWTREGGGYYSEADSVSGLSSGRYILHIIDANMCEATEIIEVTQPGQFNLVTSLSSSFAGDYNINCYGDSSASISVVTVNNVGNVSYLWSDGTTTAGRNNIPAGNYGLIVTDENNCAVQTEIEITQPDSIELTFNILQPWCPDKPDGAINMNVAGGVPLYSYKWSDNSTGTTISEIFEGIYSVTVSDANGCLAKSDIILRSQYESCLVIPNAISPNGDLINDVWHIDYNELYPDMEVSILNRWGRTVWKSAKGYPDPWDGTNSRGRSLSLDSYHYIIDFGDGRRPQVGSITIVK